MLSKRHKPNLLQSFLYLCTQQVSVSSINHATILFNRSNICVIIHETTCTIIKHLRVTFITFCQTVYMFTQTMFRIGKSTLYEKKRVVDLNNVAPQIPVRTTCFCTLVDVNLQVSLSKWWIFFNGLLFIEKSAYCAKSADFVLQFKKLFS